MICTYDKNYVERARIVMAHMLDYAVHGLHYELEDFFLRFIVSDICPKFERGQASVIAGRSGTEIVYEVLNMEPEMVETREDYVAVGKSPEYWLGWSLAYYQWHSGLRFFEIVRQIPIQDIREMYWKYHEMDIQHFVERMDRICHQANMETRLKAYRKRIGLSQRDLAERTEIPSSSDRFFHSQ